MIITPTFTTNFDTNFGANATAARAAWVAAAQVFTSHFSDSININITVDAAAGTNVFGQSSTSLLSISYADLLAAFTADAVTQNDQIAIGPGGSMTAADPTSGTGTWWLTRSQAKALGHIPDDMSGDGTTTFGAGNPFTFSGAITAGTFDFQGVAAHEISEIMGRLGLSGGSVGTTANSFSLIDNFSYTGPGTKGLRGGPGNNFSIDNGTTLLKLFNDPTVNNLDSRDWAPGTNDAFNQFSAPGVVNPVSAVDLQLMDVLGYDLVTKSVVSVDNTLAFIKTNNTPNGHVEVHLVSGTSGYQTRILETATTFVNESDGVWQLLPNQDLVFIKTNNTPNGHVEVHIASRASGYQTRILETATTFANESDGVWQILVP